MNVERWSPDFIYAVSSGEYSDYRVLCVCLTKDAAEVVASKIRGSAATWHRDAFVEELMLVTAEVEQILILAMSTTLWDDGTETNVSERTEADWPFGPFAYTHTSVPMAWRWVRAPIHKGRGGRLDVSGTDHELVRRTYSDKRAQLIAEHAVRSKLEDQGRVAR